MSADVCKLRGTRLPAGRRTISALALLCLAPLASSVMAASNTDLLGVVRQTLDTNPEIQSRVEAFYAASEDSREVFGGYLPSVDLNAAVGRGNRQYDNRSDYSRNLGEVSVTQMLFDGFRVSNRLARFEHTGLVRYYELLDEAENKALEATQAYLDVLRHRELVALSQENVANHLRTRAHVEERAGSGVGNRADLEQIDGRLSLARINRMTAIANLQSVTARFQRLVGEAPAQGLAPVSLPEGRVPGDLAAVLRTGYANNPALYAAFENTQVATAALEETKSSRYPTVELGMRQGIYKNNNSFDNRTDPESYGSENVIELRARYNLYRGGSDRAAERAAYRRINQAESLRDKACVDLRQTATIAYTDVLNLSEQRTFLQNHSKASESVVRAYREQFDIGRRSLLDVLDSENEAFQAERASVNGEFDLQIAKVRTLHSMGQLLQSLSVESDVIPTLQDSRSGDAAAATSRYCATLTDAQLDIGGYSEESVVEEVIELSGDALFDVGSAQIKTDSQIRLQRFVDTLNGDQITAINIVGHTDNTGSDALNRPLSLARATAVRDFLVESGVNASIISASGVAADQPIASNASAEGRSANRRVALHLIQAN